MVPLIIFAKVPLVSFAKTRIAAVCGSEIADRIYRELLAATAGSVAGLLYHVAFTGAASAGELVDVFPEAQSFFPQSSGTLGERMHHAFTHIFAQENVSAAIAIGCDCPSLTERRLRQAIDHLQKEAEVVIVPAFDGGYNLIGCRLQALSVFQAGSWGKPELLRETLDIIHAHGFRLELLPELPDIDTFEEYLQWRK